MPKLDFNAIIHALRTDYLKAMPAGAQVLVSAGCSGRWYFDWVTEQYGPVAKHYGVEAYSPQPQDLPANAIWLKEEIDSMRSIPDGSADLVFAGQTIEHLWPSQFAGFLLEARRVLQPGGTLVMDSPNRLVTHMTGWYQPQHTAELRVDEIVKVTKMAGFKVDAVKGMWLCYDREKHLAYPFEPENYDTFDFETDPRVSAAVDRPQDSFIWWLEASADDTPSQPKAAIEAVLQSIYDQAFDAALNRWWHSVGTASGQGRNRLVKVATGEIGYPVFGPYIPLRPGTHSAHFHIGLTQPPKRPERQALLIDVSAEMGTRTIAQRWLSSWDLKLRKLTRFDLTFESSETLFGVEFRVLTHGKVAVAVRAPVDYLDHGQWRAMGLAPNP